MSMTLTEHLNQVEPYKKFHKPKWLNYSIDYEDIKDLDDEKIKEILVANTTIEATNNNIRRSNQLLFDDYSKSFLEEFRRAGCLTHGVRGGVNAPYKTVLSNLKSSFKVDLYPAIPSAHEFKYKGESIHLNGSPLEKFTRFKKRVARIIEQELAANKLYIASIKYALENEIKTDDVDAKILIDRVSANAKYKFEEEKYPPGTDMDLDDNYCGCESWTVGERRCDCGNRRVYLEIEGDILSGFFGRAQVY